MSVVGIVDGIVAGNADVIAMFSLITFGLLVLWLRISWHRPAVPVRADLVRWMEGRAIEGGESAADVADRAIASYRAGLTPRDVDD